MTNKLNSFAASCYRYIFGIKRPDKVSNADVPQMVNVDNPYRKQCCDDICNGWYTLFGNLQVHLRANTPYINRRMGVARGRS